MKMKFATCCWLLLALAGTTALAQTQPPKKTVRQQAIVRKQVPSTIAREDTEPYPLLKEDYPLHDGHTAVAEALDSTGVYVYVEQMPMLNGRPLMAASIAAINQRLVIPPAAPDGRVFVGFEVTKAGIVRNVRLLKGMRADVDSAVVMATRQLPRFAPGKQNGHAVAVRTVVPITIPVKKQP